MHTINNVQLAVFDFKLKTRKIIHDFNTNLLFL